VTLLKLPPLPAHWTPTRLDRVATVNARIGWKALTADEYVPDGFAFLATPNIKGNEIDFDNVNYIDEFRFDESPELKLQCGDVLLVKDGNTLGITNVVVDLPRQSTVNGSIAVIRTSHLDPRFLRYVLASDLIQEMIAALKGGMGVPHLFQADIKKLPVPRPPISTQRAIANYLDRETARIDALIAAKQRMVELLAERWLVAARELLRGRGIAKTQWRPGPTWLGLVPLDWVPRKIAWAKSVGSGTTPASETASYYSDDEGTPWVTTAELREVEIVTTLRKVTAEALRDYSALKVFSPGTLLIAMYGATVGRLAILGTFATVNQACCAISGDGDLDQRFLFWWLRAFRSDLVEMAYGAGQPNISQETVRSLRIPAPSLGQQQEIALVVARERNSVDAVSGYLERQITLLQERRQALITAAVTGQLDIPEAA
jgi:type I restriction enzyme S subunit